MHACATQTHTHTYACRAAVLIQCNWRMHFARETIADIKNPKKKGKKGKGGGKNGGKKKK